MSSEQSDKDEATKETTIPNELSMSAYGFTDETVAKSMIYKIHGVLSVLSKNINLSDLDGVTITCDYDYSLKELDRGYETNHVLTATKDVAVGVAMTPRVLREGNVRSHMVFNADYVADITDEPGEETEAFNKSLHLLAHESAHVEVTALFDAAFPGWLLKHQHPNILDNLRWQVILACWEEYAVCRICRDIGYDPLEGYAETFVSILESTDKACVEAIKSYRLHGNVEQVVCDVFGKLGDLLKYASYFLGALHGIGKEISDFSYVQSTLKGSCYENNFQELSVILNKLMDRYGEWPDMASFEELGDLVEAMAKREGIIADRMNDQQIYFDIPHRPKTMPD